MSLGTFFTQFKIRKKLSFAFTFLATIPMLLTGLLGIKYTVSLLEENSLDQLKSSISKMQIKVDGFLNEAKNDIFYLRDSYVFRQFIKSMTEKDGELSRRKEVVQEQFRDFAKNRDNYYQLRFLDRFANEILKVEYDGSQATIIPEAKLTKRQDVFYLYHVENSSDRELLYTPVELRDDAKIVPAISYFVPIYNQSNGGSLQGILIANVYARKLFDILSEEPTETGRKTILADNNGYYLFNSTKSEWNKLLALRKEGNVDHDFPEAIKVQLLSGKEGLIDNGWKEIIAYAPIFFTGSADNFMVLFHSISRDLIRKPIVSFMKLVFIFGAFTFAVALLMGFKAADHFTKPIKALSKSSEMLAKGRFDCPVEIDTKDEIEQLASDFNRMAREIDGQKKQLKEYAGELENKVQERTQELSKTLNYLQNLIDSSIDAIITLDAGRNITFFSRGAEEILGYRAEEVLGKQICSFCQDCLMEQCPISDVPGNQKMLKSHQIEFRNNSGESVPLSISASPINNENGNVVGVLTISKDMTEQKKMEQQIQQAEKLAGIGQLAAGLAHQLNTPLASIILSAQMLKDLIKDNEILEDLDTIERQGDHCKKLIQDLLNFSRQPQKQKTEMSLEETMSVAIRLMEQEFLDRKIQVQTNLNGCENNIYGNLNQIEQLFFNLFQNACDAMPEGGRVDISMDKEPDNIVKITIKDSGSGIAKENLNKVFDPFFTTKEVGLGTGLGLSVCYGIVEQHRGTIKVNSQTDEGTSFIIEFPTV